MPRGKKSPVKRKTRKTSPRRRVSPRRVKRKTSPRRRVSPRRVKRKTSPRRKTYRRRLNPPSKFDTNRELMERLDADREAVRQNRKRVEERKTREEKRVLLGFDRNARVDLARLDPKEELDRQWEIESTRYGKKGEELSEYYEDPSRIPRKVIRHYLNKHGLCIANKVLRNRVPVPGKGYKQSKYILTADDMAELCNINRDDFNTLIRHLESLKDTRLFDLREGYKGAYYADTAKHLRNWYNWDWEHIYKYYM